VRRILIAASLALWGAVILLPLLVLFVRAVSSSVEPQGQVFASAVRSFLLAAVISAVAVLLGYIPGRLLGSARSHQDLLILLLLMPLLLPRYVLYYAWSLLLTPNASLGTYLAGRPAIARAIHALTSSAVLVLWYWPLAALLISQGWRNIDRQIWDSASLDAKPLQIFKNITLPLLARPLSLAFAVCFVMSLSEFATFHLAGIQTIGTELAVLYQQTGSHSQVALAAWPVAAAALVLALVLAKSVPSWTPSAAPPGTVEVASKRWRWVVLVILIAVSVGAPLALLAGNVTDTTALKQFLKLHVDDLAWSLVIAAAASVMAHVIAFGVSSLAAVRRAGAAPASQICKSLWRKLAAFIVRVTVFLAMLVPASLVAVSLLEMLAVSRFPAAFRTGWYIVSAGQAARFAGVALILITLTRYSHHRQLAEMASLDGAQGLKAWLYVHWPQTWPVVLGSFILIAMLSVTELSATMVLLPAGLPNFAQRLLNQMHYLGDQQVIASCLVLTCLFLSLAAVIVLLLRFFRLYRRAVLLLLAVCLLAVTGCDDASEGAGGTKVLYAFGRTGRGPAEFIYPRAIDIDAEGLLFIADKTGRIQHLTPQAELRGLIKMPVTEAGKPTGISVGPNGNLYVADTHYHRVVVFSSTGELIKQFGKFGREDGCFIYPTDVAFASDGRIFVSEYGGNDRVSIYTNDGRFLKSFGAAGSGPGEFARPSALRVDASRSRLYVADACNHRIAVYDLDGNLTCYIGSLGRDAGQLRYPYDVALLSDGTIVVCEFGNNRIQLFSADGATLAVYGGPGRRLGELAYPWGVAVDKQKRAFIVDAGNNRIQVWQL
jgi:ABC-type Fe3+ transport system permease subunit/DNA-binding beta-propeller fold protein YncE